MKILIIIVGVSYSRCRGRHCRRRHNPHQHDQYEQCHTYDS